MDTSTDSLILTSKPNQNKLKNSVFKKPNRTEKEAFMVSLNESNSFSQESTTATTITNKKNLFTRTKRSNTENLNISACDSLSESEFEKTSYTAKSKNLFKKKVATPTNQFNVFFEDTTIIQNNSNNLENQTVENSIDSTISEARPIPFQKGATKQQKHLFNIEFDETVNNEESQEILSKKQHIFQKSSLNIEQFNVLYDDSVTQHTQTSQKLSADDSKNDSHIQRKKSLFQKHSKVSNDNIFNTDLNDSEISNDSRKEKDSTRTFNALPATPISNKENFELFNGTSSSIHGIPRATTETQNSVGAALVDYDNNLHNLSKNNNSQTNSEIYNTQSSYNDDNLDNWMSSESDAEISPPNVSPIATNFGVVDEEVFQAEKTATQKNKNLSFWENKFNDIVSNASKKKHDIQINKSVQTLSKPNENKKKPVTSKSVTQQQVQIPTKLRKPAFFANKRLYHYIIKKIKPKFGIDSLVKAEELILSICETVKIVTRRKDHQKKLIEKLKKEMAIAGLIETTIDFNEFVIKFLPYNFRIKVVPCLQPITNTIYPPRSTINPFDKIL